MNIALIIVALIIIGAGAGFALLRGLPKTRIRGIKNVACFLLALLFTLLVKGSANLATTATNAMEGALEGSSAEVVQTILADGSVLGFVGALLAPLLFLCFFIGFEILLGIAYIIVTAVLKDRLYKEDCDAPFKTLRALLWGILPSILIAVALVTPISAYSEYAKTVAEALPEEESYTETVDAIESFSNATDTSLVVKTHRALFGWLDNSFASFKVNGEKTSVKTELPAIAASVDDLTNLLGTEEITAPENVTPIRNIADRMGTSPLLSSLVGTAIFEFTDEYLKNASATDDAFTYAAMTILHNDADKPEKLRADFYTMADLLTVSGALSGNVDASKLDDLLAILNANSSMKPLTDAVKKMAMDAVSETVSFGKDENGEYNESVKSTVSELNEISKLSKEEQTEKVAACVKKLLTESGITATDARIEYFTGVVVDELLPEQGGELTPESTEDFLRNYIYDHYSELKAKGLI